VSIRVFQRAARLLQQALVDSRQRGNYPNAIKLVNQAKDLAPTYAEVYKIAAFLKAHSGDFLDAQEEYEQALQLSPDSPQILFFYAGFRAYHLKDSAGAFDLVERASKLDPNNRQIRLCLKTGLSFVSRCRVA
jgi:LuxR family transcriptional regulator, glucitol operon activator